MKTNSIELCALGLDFDALQNWRDAEHDNIPISGYLAFYKACGLMPYIKENFSEDEANQVCPVNNILCNFTTMKKIKNFIINNWETFNIDLLGDEQIVWIKGERKKQRKRPKKRKSEIRHSIDLDFANYCPGLDDELEDDVITLVKYEKFDEVIEAKSLEKEGK